MTLILLVGFVAGAWSLRLARELLQLLTTGQRLGVVLLLRGIVSPIGDGGHDADLEHTDRE